MQCINKIRILNLIFYSDPITKYVIGKIKVLRFASNVTNNNNSSFLFYNIHFIYTSEYYRSAIHQPSPENIFINSFYSHSNVCSFVILLRLYINDLRNDRSKLCHFMIAKSG